MTDITSAEFDGLNTMSDPVTDDALEAFRQAAEGWLRDEQLQNNARKVLALRIMVLRLVIEVQELRKTHAAIARQREPGEEE